MPRHTPQRRAIERAFDTAGRPLSPQEALTVARVQAPALGQATVYRAIRQLLDEGVLTCVELPGQPQRYEMAGLKHHHHFRCRSCDRVFDVPGCALHGKVDVPRDFRVEEHEVWLVGLCSRCVRFSA